MPEARRRVLGELGAMMRHQCASWHAPPPDSPRLAGENFFASDPLHRQPHASVGPDSHGHGRHRHGIWPQIEAKAREKSS